MVASDATLSVQAPSLRYYTNRVSPAKKSIKLDFFFYCLLRTRNNAVALWLRLTLCFRCKHLRFAIT